MLRRFKLYQVWDYLILLASAFPPAKRITELQRQKQYCFLSGALKQTDYTKQKMELDELEASSSTWTSLNCTAKQNR